MYLFQQVPVIPLKSACTCDARSSLYFFPICWIFMFVYIKSKHGDYKSVCWVCFSVSKVRDIPTSGASLSPKSLKSGYLRALHRNVKYFPSVNSAQRSVSQNFSKNSNSDTVFIAFLNFGPSFLSDRKILQMISGVSISLSNVADPGNGLSSISVRIWEYHLPSFESWFSSRILSSLMCVPSTSFCALHLFTAGLASLAW